MQKLIKKIKEFEDNFHIMLDMIDNGTTVLFEDESTIRDYLAICATWFLRGKQRKIKTYGQHKGVGLFGILEYKTGRVLCQTSDELNAQNFQAFLENTVFSAYKENKIIMILDNSKIHHAKILAPFKEAYKDKIEFLFLPPYAPTINRIEGLQWSSVFVTLQPNIHKFIACFKWS